MRSHFPFNNSSTSIVKYITVVLVQIFFSSSMMTGNCQTTNVSSSRSPSMARGGSFGMSTKNMEAFYTLDQLVPCHFPLVPHCCYNGGLFLWDMLQHIVLFPTVVSIDFFIKLHVLHIMNLILATYVHG